MTKRCPSCKTEVPRDARVCPNCPESFADESDDMPTVGTTWSIVPIVFFIAVFALVAAIWFIVARKV